MTITDEKLAEIRSGLRGRARYARENTSQTDKTKPDHLNYYADEDGALDDAADNLIGDLIDRLERAEAERDEAKKVASHCSNELIVWRAAFQSVTPGGSEFASPAAVKQWAHMLKMQAYDANKKAVLSERRALAAESTASTLSKRVEELEAALRKAREFIVNGTEFGFIRMPAFTDDPAHLTLPAVERALTGGGSDG